MNNSIAIQSCRNHFDEIAFEFHRTELAGVTVQDFIITHDHVDDVAFGALSSIILKLDNKIGRVWLTEPSTGVAHNYHRSATTIITDTFDSIQRQVIAEQSDLSQNPKQIYQGDSSLCWTLAYNVRNSSGDTYIIGLDVFLDDLYQEFVNRPQATKSYISVIDRRGTVLLHPDSLLLGQCVADSSVLTIIKQVSETDTECQSTAVSEYLGIPVERMFYPLTIGKQHWVVVANIPHISINENMIEFNRYTLIIAVIAVLMFSILLALSQARWRREYHLRRKAEQESLHLQMQQIVDQINPHFLFNSLNSLYALIGKNTDTAREFVLSLSRVYRNVLESGRDMLSPLGKEIEFVCEYYFLQKIRFNEQIDLIIEIGDEFKAYKLPTMSVETVVENAIKHNEITPDNPLMIKIFIVGEKLIIENNYTPRKDSEVESFGVGLERIRAIYKLYDNEQMVIVCDGNSFRCELPLLS